MSSSNEGGMWELMIAQSNHVVRIASAATFAILYFDYAVTFDAEVERFWKARFSSPSFVFYLNRYLSLFGHIPVIYQFYWANEQSVCSKVQMYHQILAGLTQVIVAGLQIFRIHALYHDRRSIVLFLTAFCIVGCAISGWSLAQTWQQPTVNYTYSRKDFPGVGCDFSLSETQGLYLAVIWAITLAFDFSVFVLTMSRIAPIASKCRGTLFTLFLRDGSFYFVALFACHLSNILSCLLATPVYKGISVTTTNVIASSLITRLMLNIRDPNLIQGRYRWPSDASQVERYSEPHSVPLLQGDPA
ncbi:hypothetical protein V8D89_007596 [Ganoderma adspersum]